MKSKPSNFFTRKPANTGARMPLADPVTGKPTEDYLHVLGLECDSFRDALAVKHRRNIEILAMPESEQAAALEEADLVLHASLVTGWSFEEPFTVDGVIELLREAPQIKIAVDKFASDRANFIKRLSKT